MLPGFIDAHLHFGAYALAVQEVDLDACASLGAGPDILRRAAERLPPNAWLRGRGWDRNRWACLPTSADLDVRGSLTVAKDADLVVLSGDPFEAESWAAR